MDLKLQCGAPIQTEHKYIYGGRKRGKETKTQTAGQSIFAEYSFIRLQGEAKIKKRIRLKLNCELIRIYPRAYPMIILYDDL